MLTREQALNERHFHLDGCTETVGPRGGRQCIVTRVRRASQTKTRPGAYAFTVKYGMSSRTSTVTQHEGAHMHTAADCPLPSQRYA